MNSDSFQQFCRWKHKIQRSLINKTKAKIKGQKNWMCSCNEQLEIIPAFAVLDKGQGTGMCDGNIFISFDSPGDFYLKTT